jgi:tetratricopeptide (TPR) repeat protein
MSGSQTSAEDGSPQRAVFLSYAREDTAVAQRIAEALRSHGVEVWFDQNELRGGDAWDAKIRRQIDACTLFLPIVSQHTEERGKGYFRLEWKLAVEQTHLLMEGVPFLVPVVVDNTPDSTPAVPAEFRRVQWTRLPGALPTPEFVEQIRRLLQSPHLPGVSTRSEGSAVARAPDVRKSSPLAWAILAVVAFGAGVAFFVLRPSGSKAPAATPLNPAATPLSEARQLEAKAWAIWEMQDEAMRDDWMLADQLCQRAVAADPADADAWAVQSQVSLAFVIFGYDRSPERYEAAKTQAERAVRLAPSSNEAQFALANYYRRQNTTRDEGIRMLRQLVERMPTDKRVLRTLASALRGQGRDEESILYSDRANALPGGDPIAMFGKEEALRHLGRDVEGESVLDQLLAVHPSPAGYLKKLLYVVDDHGDLDQARVLLEKIPAPYLLEEWGASFASTIWLWRREPDKTLAVLNGVTKDYLEKGDAFSGPKGYFTGMARQMKGDTDAARADWQAALQVVEQRLRSQPNSVELLGWKAQLLALLGERGEGEQALRIYEQMVSAGSGLPGLIRGGRTKAALIKAALGRQDEAVDGLMQLSPKAWPALRYSPDWDCLRGNPRFQAWLKANPPAESK